VVFGRAVASPSFEAIYQQLTILLLLATLSHFTFKRFRQPTIVGEIAIGVVLGPSVLGYLGWFAFDETLVATFGTLGSIFLLFLIGLESDVRAIYTRKNFFVALGGVVLPFVAGFLAALYLVPVGGVGASGTQFTMAMFVGATLVATSTAIAASILLELGLMRDAVAQTILGAAVVDDILGLLVLSIVVGMSRGAVDPVGIVILAATAVAFVVISILIGLYFFSRIVVRIQIAGMKLGLRHGGFLIALAIAFLYAFVAETIRLSAIVGAFIAGSMFASTPLREDFMQGAGYLGAVFTPIFFISLGLAVDIPALVPVILPFAAFAGLLAAAGIITKVVGCAIPARLARMTRNEAVAVGWGMTPRGEVGLIVALAAFTATVISDALFSVIVLVMIAISILPAPFFKAALGAVTREREAGGPPAEPEPAQAS
jgi:Kef-type K+ transport system membrane component KefB